MEFSSRISKEFFSEQIILGFGFSDIIKLKQFNSIGPNEFNIVWIDFHVCLIDNGPKHEFEESIKNNNFEIDDPDGEIKFK